MKDVCESSSEFCGAKRAERENEKDLYLMTDEGEDVSLQRKSHPNLSHSSLDFLVMSQAI